MRNIFRAGSISILGLMFICVSAHAQFELLWGENQPGGLGNIHGVTVNLENGDIFICDFANVHHFDSEMERIGTINFNLGSIRGLGFDTRENLLLIANYGAGRYAIADLEGEVLENRDAGANLNTISYDPDQDLYILGDWNRRVIFRNRQHEVVSQFDVDVNITGICYYPVNGTVFVLDTNDPILEYSIDGDRIAVALPNDQITGNGQDIAYDPMSRILYATGQNAWLGAFEDNYGALPEPQIEPEAFEAAIGFGLDGEETLTITNVGEEESNLRFSLNDVGEGVDWLEIDPESGVLELDEEAEITLSYATEELEPGIFERIIIVRTNNPEFFEVEVPFELTVISGFGSLTGTVIDAAYDSPVEGAVISIPRFGFEATTAEEGVY
ncbi:hypothetical protein HQ587_10735, partial [bacterium]|nr:hypothetical protein [bacterium]